MKFVETEKTFIMKIVPNEQVTDVRKKKKGKERKRKW